MTFIIKIHTGDKRRLLRTKTDNDSKIALEEVENELAEKCGEKMFHKIKNEIKGLNGEEGGFNVGYLWKFNKKLSSKDRGIPTMMVDSYGKILTTPEEIRNEAIKHYEKVFHKKSMSDELSEYQKDKEYLCMLRLNLAKKNKTPPWTRKDVINVLKNLPKGKSKDPYGLPNEIFRPEVAGDDLILAIVKLMNRIKDEQKIPDCFNLCNVTNIYKNKGARNSYDSYRGVFRTLVLRNILDRMIYNDMYETVDNALTDCNVGSRKRSNIRDNLFVIYAILNACK